MEKNLLHEINREKSKLCKEHNDYVKYNNLLKQTIDNLIQANEQLLLSLKMRFEKFTKLKRKEYIVNANINDKVSVVNKKEIDASEISIIEKSSVIQSIEHSEKELNQAKEDLKLILNNDTDVFSQIAELQKEKELLLKEQQKLRNVINETKTEQISANENNNNFLKNLKLFEKVQSISESCNVLRNELIEIQKEQINSDFNYNAQNESRFFLEPVRIFDMLNIGLSPNDSLSSIESTEGFVNDQTFDLGSPISCKKNSIYDENSEKSKILMSETSSNHGESQSIKKNASSSVKKKNSHKDQRNKRKKKNKDNNIKVEKEEEELVQAKEDEKIISSVINSDILLDSELHSLPFADNNQNIINNTSINNIIPNINNEKTTILNKNNDKKQNQNNNSLNKDTKTDNKNSASSNTLIGNKKTEPAPIETLLNEDIPVDVPKIDIKNNICINNKEQNEVVSNHEGKNLANIIIQKKVVVSHNNQNQHLLPKLDENSTKNFLNKSSEKDIKFQRVESLIFIGNKTQQNNSQSRVKVPEGALPTFASPSNKTDLSKSMIVHPKSPVQTPRLSHLKMLSSANKNFSPLASPVSHRYIRLNNLEKKSEKNDFEDKNETNDPQKKDLPVIENQENINKSYQILENNPLTNIITETPNKLFDLSKIPLKSEYALYQDEVTQVQIYYNDEDDSYDKRMSEIFNSDQESLYEDLQQQINDIELENFQLTKNLEDKKYKLKTKLERLKVDLDMSIVSLMKQDGKLTNDVCSQTTEDIPDIDQIKKQIIQCSSSPSQQLMMNQQKTELTRMLGSNQLELKVLQMLNERKNVDFDCLLKRLKIVDPFSYYKEVHVIPDASIDENILSKKQKRVMKKNRLLSRIEEVSAENVTLSSKIDDLLFITDNLTKKLTIMAKKPRSDVKELCDSLKVDRSVINEICRQTSFVNIEISFTEGNIFKLNENYGQTSLEKLREKTDSLRFLLMKLKSNFDTLRAVKERRNTVLTCENEMRSLVSKQKDLLNILDVTKMRTSGVISKIGKQFRSLKEKNIKIPEPPLYSDIKIPNDDDD